MMDYLTKAINDWDPIGIIDITPKDEYAPEINEIRSRASGISNEEELANIIYDVFQKYFDDFFKSSKAECLNVARSILSKGMIEFKEYDSYYRG